MMTICYVRGFYAELINQIISKNFKLLSLYAASSGLIFLSSKDHLKLQRAHDEMMWTLDSWRYAAGTVYIVSLFAPLAVVQIV